MEVITVSLLSRDGAMEPFRDSELGQQVRLGVHKPVQPRGQRRGQPPAFRHGNQGRHSPGERRERWVSLGSNIPEDGNSSWKPSMWPEQG